MLFTNLLVFLRMMCDIRLIRFAWRLHRRFRGDRNYTLPRVLRLLPKVLQGERIVRFRGAYVFSSFVPPVPSEAFVRFVTASPQPENHYSQQMLAQRSAPISCYLSVTDRCTYHCFHCSARGRSHGEEMSTQEWRRVIGEVQEMGTSILAFTGGEPLLRDDLEELVRAADHRSISFVFTSGRGFTRERALSLQRAGAFGVGISLDSTDARVHNEKRGDPGAFDAALAALRNAREAGLYVMAQVMVLRREFSELELLGLFRLARRHGAHEVRVLEPIPSGRLMGQGSDEGVFLTEEDRRRLIHLQESVNRRPGYPKVSVFAHTEGPERYGCGAGTQHSYIAPDGQLYPCDFVPLSFGSVREGGVAERWRAMNAVIGLPKCRCFAMDLCAELAGREGALPVAGEEAIALCQARRAEEYPAIYRVMQGKR